MAFSTLTLKSKKDQAVRRLHPWIFSNAIKSVEGEPQEGDVVAVQSNKGKMLGYGHYQEQGSISVRMLVFGETEFSEDWIFGQIQKAWDSRIKAGLNSGDSNCFRLIYAEGDGLPGLVVDFYNGYAVVQFHSTGMYFNREKIASYLLEIEEIKGVYSKSESVMKRFGLGVADEWLAGEQVDSVLVKENNHTFEINWMDGQKTGFFLDQRDNRQLLASFVEGKSLLNTFCYTGGFSVYALQAGASRVDSVDSSAPALEMLEKNLKHNAGFSGEHHTIQADAMNFVKDLPHDYDVVILDPPAFAKSRNARHNAVQGYKRLNATTMRQMKAGSVLFTFSCSQVVDASLFKHTIVSAGLAAERNVKILHHLSQPADHPISLYHPEGEYLKGLVLEIS